MSKKSASRISRHINSDNSRYESKHEASHVESSNDSRSSTDHVDTTPHVDTTTHSDATTHVNTAVSAARVDTSTHESSAHDAMTSSVDTDIRDAFHFDTSPDIFATLHANFGNFSSSFFGELSRYSMPHVESGSDSRSSTVHVAAMPYADTSDHVDATPHVDTATQIDATTHVNTTGSAAHVDTSTDLDDLGLTPDMTGTSTHELFAHDAMTSGVDANIRDAFHFDASSDINESLHADFDNFSSSFRGELSHYSVDL